MPALTAPLPTPTQVAVDPGTVRLVLFGMPDSGKTSLLGALVQAAHSQQQALKGKVNDLSNGLAELWRRVYDDRQLETRDEIVSYPIVFDPTDGSPRIEALVYDCDGRIANEYLALQKSLGKNAPLSHLAKAVLEADALLLLIDASAANDQVETDFREFSRFLDELITHRGQERAVGCLPIHLVLTKCDLLAREPIPREEWERRVGIRRKQVRDRFADYFQNGSAGFGSIDVHLNQTAVRRPALKGMEARPRDPFGVAELFRDCLRSARRFHQREARADRYLRWTVGIAVVFITIALLGAVFLLLGLGMSHQPPSLIDRVARFAESEKPLPDRLADSRLTFRTKELTEFRHHADFEKLPDDKKTFVRERFEEVETYRKIRERVGQLGKPGRPLPPELTRSLAELKTTQEFLEGSAELPSTIEEEWQQHPPPGLSKRDELLKQIKEIRAGVDELVTFNAGLMSQANDRLFAPEFQRRWIDKVDGLLEIERRPPITSGDGVKATALVFGEVRRAEDEWRAVRGKLVSLRDLALALGIVGDPDKDAAVLVFPKMLDGDLNAFASAKLTSIRTRYPSFESWSLEGIPEPLKDDVRKSLQSSYDHLIRASRRMILNRFREIRPRGDDEWADWQMIAPWLQSPELKDWRELVGLLAHIFDPKAADPVATTAAFLKTNRIELQIKAVTITLPNNLPQGAFTSEGEFKITQQYQGKNAGQNVLMFKLKDTKNATREKSYRFEIEKGEGRILFKPGDRLSAELRLARANKDWQLTWSNARTACYGFECLQREPLLRLVDAKEKGVLVDGVRIQIDGLLPTVPELLPDVLGGPSP